MYNCVSRYLLTDQRNAGLTHTVLYTDIDGQCGKLVTAVHLS